MLGHCSDPTTALSWVVSLWLNGSCCCALRCGLMAMGFCLWKWEVCCKVMRSSSCMMSHPQYCGFFVSSHMRKLKSL